MRPRSILPSVLAAGLAGVVSGGGQAQTFPMDQKVIVASQLIHPVRVSAGGLSAEERVARINERINRIIAHEPLNPGNIRLRRVGGDPAIYVGNQLVTSVTAADAAANRMTKERLARLWLRNYRVVLPQARPNSNWGAAER